MTYNRIRERYHEDTTFHQVVDLLQGVILNAKLTPSEVREAAMLACMLIEERRLPMLIREGDELRYASDEEVDRYRREGLIR